MTTSSNGHRRKLKRVTEILHSDDRIATRIRGPPNNKII
jgi:hypothetical protein